MNDLAFHHRLLLTVATIAVVVLLLLFLWQAVYVLLFVFAGILLAIFLRALTDWLVGWARLPEQVALLIVVVGIVALIVTAFIALAPRVASQVHELQEEIPHAIEEIAADLERYEWGRVVVEEVRDLTLDWQIRPAIAARAANVLTTTLYALTVALLVVFVGLYLAMSPRSYRDGLIQLLPKSRRKRGREILVAVGYSLKWWLIGRVISMTLVGVLTTIGLWLLGIPLAMSLGLIAAVLDFVPNIGPLVAAVPAILLGLVESPMHGLYVIGLYFVVQQIESYVVTPIVQERTVKLPPALTIVAQVLFFFLLGPIGLLLATPMAAAAMELIKGVYIHDVLGDGRVQMLAEDAEDEEEIKASSGR